MRSLWWYLPTRDDVGGIETSVDLWRICIQRMRPTVDVNLSSGHCESVRTRLVLISCVSDHARCMAQVQVFDPCLVTFLFAPRVIHMSSMST